MLQKRLHVDRLDDCKEIVFQKGRNWFDITHELAKYVVDQEVWIKKIFKYSHCGDEVFLQTVVRNSEFKDKICNKNTMPEVPDTRFIDWERGNPYVFKKEDCVALSSTTALFARKFDYEQDYEVVEFLYNKVRI